METEKEKEMERENDLESQGCRSDLIYALRADDPASAAKCLDVCTAKRSILLTSLGGRELSVSKHYNGWPWSTLEAKQSIVRAMDNELCERLKADKIQEPPPSLHTICFAIGAKFGCLRVVKMLLSYEYETSVDVAYSHNEHCSAISEATKNGYVEIVKLMLCSKRITTQAVNTAVDGARQLAMMKLFLNDERVTADSLNNNAMYNAIDGNDIGMVRLLLSDSRVDPSANENEALRNAVEDRQVEIVRLLLSDPRVDPSAENNEPLRHAVSMRRQSGHASLGSGHAGLVGLLLMRCPRVDASVNDDEALRQAIRNDDAQIAELLLLHDKRVDPSNKSNGAIAWAASKGHVAIVKILLKDERVNPAVNDQYPLRRAIKHGHVEVVKLLLDHEHVHMTQQILCFADRMHTPSVALGIQAVFAVRPALWPELIVYDMECKQGGNVRDELDRMEKKSSFALLLCVKRAFSPTVAGRMADVLREVHEEWTPFATQVNDAIAGASSDYDANSFYCGDDWLSIDDEGYEDRGYMHIVDHGWPNFANNGAQEIDDDQDEYDYGNDNDGY